MKHLKKPIPSYCSIVHNVLETLYRPVLGKALKREDILEMIRPRARFRELVNKTAEKYENKNKEGISIEKGKWIIFPEVATLYAERFIQYDASQAP